MRYLVEQEWARTAEDVVWRRSKLGLRLSSAEIDRLETRLSESMSIPVREAMR